MKKYLSLLVALFWAFSVNAATTVYFINSDGWTTVNAYVWGDNAKVSWPGEAMTKTAQQINGFDVYSYDVDETTYPNIIFTNRTDGSDQTSDLKVADGVYYYWKDKKWYASADAVPALEEAPQPMNTGYWNFDQSDLMNLGSINGNVIVRGITLVGGDKKMKVESVGPATLGDSTYTYMLNFDGTSREGYREVIIPTKKNTKIELWVYKKTNSERTFSLQKDAFGGETLADLKCSVKEKIVDHLEYNHIGEDANIWLSVNSSNCYLCAVKLTPYVNTNATGIFLTGAFNEWNTEALEFNKLADDNTKASATLTLAKATEYEFKIVDNGTWLGNNGTITADITGWVFSSSEGNCKLQTAAAGDYLFTLDLSTKALSVTYPAGKNYWIKHPWGGGNWEWQAMELQADYTHTYTGLWGDNGVNIADNANGSNDSWIEKKKITNYENATKGDTVTFVYDADANTVTLTNIKTPVVDTTTVVTDVFTVAGSSAALFGTTWDAANTDNDMSQMTVEGTTGYVLIKQNVELKAKDTIQWKVVKNHSWDVNYGDPQNNNNNYQYIITKDGKYNAAFVFMEIAGYGHMAEATFEPVDPTATVYYVAGNKELTGYDWKPDSLAMSSGAIIIKDVPAGTHAFKITDGQWNTDTETGHEFTTLSDECPTTGLTHDTDGNITFTTDKVQDITIVIAEGEICVLVDAVVVTPVDTNTYYIVGELVPWGWDNEGTADETPMTLKSEGVYEFVVDTFAAEAKTYQYKLRANKTWTDSYQLPANGNAEYAFNEAGNYRLVFTADVNNHTLNLEATKLGGEPTVVEYYIKHPWGTGTDEAWEWKKMNLEATAVIYTAEGLWGGRGANINTTESDAGAAWFPVENIKGYDAAAIGDTVVFTFNPADTTLSVTVTGKAPVVVADRYIKHPWAGGEWTWKKMNFEETALVYTIEGIWGGYGANINTEMVDSAALWFAADEISGAGNVNVGDTVVFSYNLATTSLSVTIIGKVPEVYTVVGTAVNGDNWNPNNTENDMTLNADGLYVLVVKEKTLEEGIGQFKIIKNRSWEKADEIYPNLEGNGNATFDVTETAVYTITYTYNPAETDPTKMVTVTLLKTGEAQPITHVYSLVGTAFDWGWELGNAPEMTKLNDSIYTYQIDSFAVATAPDTIYYKLTADHQWGVYELPASGDYYYVFNQIGSYQLNFTANIASHYVVLEATQLNTDTTIVENKYYIAGSMNSWTVNGTELVNGEVVLTLAAGKHQFKVTDGTWNNTWGYDQVDQECSTATVTRGTGSDDNNIIIELSKEQEVTISFNSATRKVCVKAETGEAPKVYYVAGDEGLMGAGHGWWKDYADRALVNGTIIIKDVPAGAHAFKITDGNWNSDTETGHEFTALDTECSSQGVTGGNGNNIEFTTYKVQDVTIAMDLTTFAICVTADCEKPAEFEDTYVIAGDEKLLGVSWSGTAEQNKMTVKDGVATLVIDTVTLAAGNYEFKVVKNGGQWIPDGTGNNSVLSINEAGDYKVTFTYVIGEPAASAVAEKLGEPVVVDVDYYLFGYINGANYGCEDDYQNMGDYKFVDGKLSATFTQTSYVAVKTTDNAAWYMTKGYPGDDATSAVLYNTTLLGEDANKLPVPANVTVNFTLVVNEDATLTLSYIADGTGSGLENVEALLDVNAPMYNVLGQKVSPLYKGIVIQNGQKFMLR